VNRFGFRLKVVSFLKTIETTLPQNLMVRPDREVNIRLAIKLGSVLKTVFVREKR
jgi:hypothetical protein